MPSKSPYKKEAYSVETAGDFNTTCEKLFIYEYDCILLDIMRILEREV
ncbi:MAG: hypothetical protein R2806_25350 [Saprospiraceae bacterium]